MLRRKAQTETSTRRGAPSFRTCGDFAGVEHGAVDVEGVAGKGVGGVVAPGFQLLQGEARVRGGEGEQTAADRGSGAADVTGAAGGGLLLPEVAQQPARAALVLLGNVFRHGLRALLGVALQELVLGHLEVEVARHQAAVVQGDHVAAVGGDVFDHVLQREAVEQLVQPGDVDSDGGAERLLVDRHGVAEYARVAAHQELQDRGHAGVGQADVVELVAAREYAHAGVDRHVLRPADVPRRLEVAQRAAGLGGVEREVRGEFLQTELQLRALAGVVDYLMEDVQLLVDVLDVLRRREGEAEHLAHAPQVGLVPQQHRVGALPVAAGAPRLLEIRLRAVGRREVHHEAHVGLVDAHSEGVGTHHHANLTALPGILPLGAQRGAEAGMVERRAHSPGLQHGGGLLALAAVAHVDDAGAGHAAADVQQLAGLVFAAADYI